MVNQTASCPRPAYPRPDFVREKWINLNGEWEFDEDFGRTGRERGLPDAASFPQRITVPFCRESRLSGLEHKDFCDAVWYRKEITVPANWRVDGRHVILHIGACDYHTEVYINGKSVGTHIGGMNAFCFDITKALSDGEVQTITICATDLLREGGQCGGKQSLLYGSHGCHYTRTTGIWQTVWMECVPASYLHSMKVYPSISDQKVTLQINTFGADGSVVRAQAYYQGRAVGAAAAVVEGNCATMEMKLDELHLWEVGCGRLYDLELTLGNEEDGERDLVKSYFGMRSIACHKGILHLNGKPVFQRLVLDQGFYPDGIWTAPTDEDLKADVDRSMAVGFNGARLHQKVFEPRFLYECDRAGYIVWGEHGNWGMDISEPKAFRAILPDWLEIVQRDFNHPSIIGWCPLNETDYDQDTELVRMLAAMTRALDPTRLFIETSGWAHVAGVTDIVDIHNYDQDPESFRAFFAPMTEGKDVCIHRNYYGKPTFVSEYGGIRWAPGKEGWGYGDAPKSIPELLERFRALTDVLLDHPMIGGLCYTQLTDVEQEVNGIYTYDRREKFPAEVLKEILSRKAACEE
ncbi:MAG: beta-galactosidase [Clostridia bacterium]|nr:beta-galactosidase [Clostridia bacterium]